VEAMRRGAKDDLPMPFTPPQIRHLVERAREPALPAERHGDRRASAPRAVEGHPPLSFPERIAASASEAPVLGGSFTMEEIEREHALRVMAHTSTMDEAATILGIDASTPWRKRKRWGR
jgi:NtrC-family two-component system response regulator AlgB